MADGQQLTTRSFDWTRNAPPPNEYCRYVRNYDFSATPLGSINQWPQLLRQHVCQIMLNVHPRVISWGPDMCLIQNEAARQFAVEHGRHDCLGKTMRALWPELVDSEIGAQQREVLRTAVGIHTPDMLLLLEPYHSVDSKNQRSNNSNIVERHLDMNVTPIFDSHGSVAGILHDYIDITRSVLADRRGVVIDKIEDALSREDPPSNLWSAIMTPLKALVEDVPFAIGYSIMPKTLGSLPMRERLIYEDSIGVEYEHPVVAAMKEDPEVLTLLEGAWEVDLPRFTPGQPPQSRDEIQDRKRLFRAQNNLAESRAPHMSDDSAIRVINNVFCETDPAPRRTEKIYRLKESFIARGRGFDAAVKHFIPVVIPRRNPPDPFGVLVLGMNNRRPFDRDYQSFINLLKSIIINNITSIVYPKLVRRITVDFENEARELERRAQEHETNAQRVEEVFKTCLTASPFGMGLWSRTGESTYTPTWTNDAWNDLMGIQAGDNPIVDMEKEKTGLNMDKWRVRIHPDDQHILQANWQALQQGTSLGNIQLRVLRDKPDDRTKREYQWIMLNSTHHYSRNSGVHTIGAWAVDISMEKRNQSTQIQRVDDALEAQRVTEHFIDMVSHELRNPMSAMLQSADIIASTSHDVVVEVANRRAQDLPLLCHTILDASEVMTLCVQHQKRIVDDVLTLAKLDARLLIIVPERVNVPFLMNQVVHIYEVELRAAAIETQIRIGRSFGDMQLRDVMLDPGRLIQVLMNVFTNAQKFTRNAPTRMIKLHLGASFTRPESAMDGTKFLPFRNEGVLKNDEQRAAKNVRENNQETIFLTFSVSDTGRGMSRSELKQLFEKFSQASPKTYGKYGGSGLGLFITRDLIELQGGQIAVSSKEGEGTTFSFYVKAQRILEDIKRPRLARQSSYSQMLEALKVEKGSMDRTTTELRERRRTPSPAPSPQGPCNSPFEPLRTPPYEFDPPSPGFAQEKHQPFDVLLVEDNLINQRILAQQLRKQGYAVTTVDNGLEAVHFVKRSSFAAVPTSDALSPEHSPASESSHPAQTIQPRVVVPKALSIILMDIEMPVMDGLTATRHIRGLQSEGTLVGHIPILAVTANARPDNVQSALDAGMDAVLTKPFRITELIEKMSDVVNVVGGPTSTEGMMPM